MTIHTRSFSLNYGGIVLLLLGAALGKAQLTATTTTLTSVSPAAPQFGQTVTLTATVAPSAATGSVSFMDGGVLVGVGTLSSGSATLRTLTLPAGPHALTAVYGGVSGAYSASQSAIQPYVVTALPDSGLSVAGSYTVGSNPRFVAVGDFNGDGKPDLAVANYGSGTVSIYLGSGGGAFTLATGSPITVGSSPATLAVGDFNGDGKLDLAVANFAGGNLSILLGNGSGGFSPASGSPYQIGSPIAVAVGDFNGDGRADLAATNYTSNTVTILLGNGGGAFNPASGSPFPVGTNPESVAVGDFNRDGIPDLAIGNYGSNNVTILVGNGGGAFSAASGSPFSVGTNPQGVVVADVNGDGNPDLVVANNSPNPNVTVLLGNGSAGFSPASGSPFAGGLAPGYLTVGDFNADGKLDLALPDEGPAGNGYVTVLLGNGNGGFSPASWSPVTTGSGTGSFAVAAGDFNSDGRPDLAIANYENGTLSILLGTVPPSSTTTLLSGPNPSQFGQAVSFTANVLPSTATGSVEFLSGAASVGTAPLSSGQAILGNLALPFGTDTLRAIYDGSPSGLQSSRSNPVSQTVGAALAPAIGFMATNVPLGTSPEAVASGDFNGDGKADLVGAAANGLTILLGNGDGSFQPGINFAAGTFVSVVMGDFNGDGKADLAAANYGANNVSIFLGNGDGTFQAPSNYPVGPGPELIAVGDFNGDGKYDLAVADAGAGISVLLGNGNGSFQPAMSFAAGNGPRSLTIADFNNDGRADVAVADYNGGVSVLLGLGDGTFQSAMSFPAGANPQGIAAGDFNGDGNADLAVADYSGGVSVLLGNGNGTFQAAVNYTTGFLPCAVAVADVNADGKQDLLVDNCGGLAPTGGVSLLLGLGDGTFAAAQDFVLANPSSIAVADFNGDGRVDVATADSGSNNITVLLGGAPCLYSIGNTNVFQPDTPGSGTVSVMTTPGCPWTASSNAPFLTITAGSSGSGNGTVTYTFAANSGSPRVGTLTIAGQTLTVNQGPLPTMSLSQNVLNVGWRAGLLSDPQSVTVSFSGGARVAWSASADQPNVIVSSGSGTGLGTFQVTASGGSSDIIIVNAPGAANSPLQVQVNVELVPPGNSPFGSFDTPVNNTGGLSGSIAVTGWALDLFEVTGVDIWREPVAGEPASPSLILIGNATFVAGGRPDVEALYPGYPFNYRAGWGYLLLTNELPNNGAAGGIGNGTYKIHAIAHNISGASTDLGTKTITVNNAAAITPFGAIDTPGQGAMVSGAVTNFGWALTPPTVGCPTAGQPCIIPTNGSTIFVFVDGQSLGSPVYNLARCDVDTLFPGYANSGSTNCALNGTSPGPVGYFNLDTTQLTNGVHTIAWSVADNAGKAQGIGSRYFTVEN